ncbi:unnamed protein product [Boreogadus saida]
MVRPQEHNLKPGFEFFTSSSQVLPIHMDSRVNGIQQIQLLPHKRFELRDLVVVLVGRELKLGTVALFSTEIKVSALIKIASGPR